MDVYWTVLHLKNYNLKHIDVAMKIVEKFFFLIEPYAVWRESNSVIMQVIDKIGRLPSGSPIC